MSFDVLSALCAWLGDKTGAPASVVVPDPRPEEFITVERVGGESLMGRDEPNLAVQTWGGTYERAYALALQVRDLLIWNATMEIPQVCSTEVGSIYEFTDESRQPRFQLDVYLVTRL